MIQKPMPLLPLLLATALLAPVPVLAGPYGSPPGGMGGGGMGGGRGGMMNNAPMEGRVVDAQGGNVVIDHDSSGSRTYPAFSIQAVLEHRVIEASDLERGDTLMVLGGRMGGDSVEADAVIVMANRPPDGMAPGVTGTVIKVVPLRIETHTGQNVDVRTKPNTRFFRERRIDVTDLREGDRVRVMGGRIIRVVDPAERKSHSITGETFDYDGDSPSSRRPGAQGMTPPGDDAARIVRMDGATALVSEAGGEPRPVRLSGLRLLKQREVSLASLERGSMLALSGQRQGGDRFLAQQAVEVAPGSAPPQGAGEWITGEVRNADPLHIRTPDGERLKVTLAPGARILKEREISRDDLRKGDRVKVLPDRLIVLEGDGASPSPREPLPVRPMEIRAGGMPERGGGNGFTGAMVAAGPGPGMRPPSYDDLPRAQKARDSQFSREALLDKADSPFGFFDPNMPRHNPLSWNQDYADVMNDLGARWSISGATFTFSWNLLQGKNHDGSYTAFRWERHDDLVRYNLSRNIQMVGILQASEPNPSLPVGSRVKSDQPRDMEGYRRFVQAVVERYDLDGEDDMPGLQAPIRFWVVENEPITPTYFKGKGDDYAAILANAYPAIKRASPEATVIAGMVREPDWLARDDPRAFMNAFFTRLEELAAGQQPYDMLDQHWIGGDPKRSLPEQYALVRQWVRELDEAAQAHGFRSVPLVDLEMAGRHDNERVQAEDLVKRYAFLLGLGFRKVFWSGVRSAPEEGLSEQQKRDFFRRIAVMDDDGGKKLSYHAYKLMVEVLEGSSWAKTRILREEDGQYVVRFEKQGKPVWVAWNDNGGKEKITLEMPESVGEVEIVEGVPEASRGREVREYANAFAKSRGLVHHGTLELTVGATPVYVIGY